jgi:hypothetical protein
MTHTKHCSEAFKAANYLLTARTDSHNYHELSFRRSTRVSFVPQLLSRHHLSDVFS